MPRPKIILASESPRRKELLSLITHDFDVVPSDFDESLVPQELPPCEHVVYSATMKARDVAARIPNALIIGADTEVVVNSVIMGKPNDGQDAARMLRELGGKSHQVYTGITIIFNGAEKTACECTDVRFRDLTEEIITRYVATGEPMDKAGAYAIQGVGSVLIESISGCYFNVVGLPLHRLSRLLEEFDIEPLSDCLTNGCRI